MFAALFVFDHRTIASEITHCRLIKTQHTDSCRTYDMAARSYINVLLAGQRCGAGSDSGRDRRTIPCGGLCLAGSGSHAGQSPLNVIHSAAGSTASSAPRYRFSSYMSSIPMVMLRLRSGQSCL